MPTIAIRFPGGRYHATPWGYHVNEGQVEWPPCPWRLLRALIAAGYATQGWDEVPATGRRLIETLASVLPFYQLPQASAAHSRHYMPIGALAKGLEKTTLVFDTWANIGQDELIVRWDCELDEEANALFTTLVESLGYLGRSESWAECRTLSDDFVFESQQSAVPCTLSEYPGPDWEQVSLMAPISVETYAQWRQQQSETVLAELPLPEGKKKPKKTLLDKRAKAMAPYPEDLLDCLQKDTNWWKKQHKWSQPPGSQRVLYWRRRDALTVTVPATTRKLENHRIEAILLAITTGSRNTAALPHIHRTLPQGELFHRALVGRVGKGRKIDCPELTGQQENGQHLEEGHQHAHILPLDLDGDQHLDHVLIYAKMGLGDQAQRAIRSMKRTWSKGGVGDLQVAVVGRGDLDSLRQIGEPLNVALEKLLGPPHGATTWISQTPLVMPRYIKKNGRNSLEGQIQAELQSRGLPKAVDIDILKDQSIQLRHYIRVRKHGGNPPPQDAGYAVRLTLERPVTGPLTLGYGSHFGLGLFVTAGALPNQKSKIKNETGVIMETPLKTYHIKTLTPIWTGGVKPGKMDRLHETGIIGSLRWWYEILVRGLGGHTCNPTADKPEDRCQFDTKAYEKTKQVEDGLIEVCPVCRLFGCTGWKHRFQLSVKIESNQLVPLCLATLDPSDQLNHWWLSQVFKTENSKIVFGDLTIQTHFMRGYEKNQEILNALFSLAAALGGIGAKLQYGFGQFSFPDTLPIDESLGILQAQLIPNKKNSVSADFYSLKDLWCLNGSIADTDSQLKWFQKVNIIGDRQAFKKLENVCLPVSFDIRYKLPLAQDKGLRQAYRLAHGKDKAREVFGTVQNEENKWASRIFVSHLFRGNSKDNWQLRVWGFTNSNIRDEIRTSLKNTFQSIELSSITGQTLLETQEKQT